MAKVRKLAIVVAACLLATLLWFCWPGEKSAGPVATQSPARQQSTNAPEKKRTASFVETETAKPEPVVQMLPTHATVQTATNKLDPDEFVAETLKHPDQSTLPSKIPPLSDAQVDQLTAAYMKIAKPTQKSGLLWALGFSQNDRAFDTLRYAMLDEYSGQVLSTADNVAQLQVVPLIGVLTRTSDRAPGGGSMPGRRTI
jgi:hypothetical protein